MTAHCTPGEDRLHVWNSLECEFSLYGSAERTLAVLAVQDLVPGVGPLRCIADLGQEVLSVAGYMS